MSTFDGFIKEFPEITIDCFRQRPGRKGPIISFLSHAHSDHLRGLESQLSIPIYCSPATRKVNLMSLSQVSAETLANLYKLLLNLETHAHRMNYANGILERRKKQYGHLVDKVRGFPHS